MGAVGSSIPSSAALPRADLGGTLFLEGGLRFDGAGLGAARSTTGEVVFTTGMVGYPESLTDPSYLGQILTFTYPLLGNYGVPDPKRRDAYGLPANVESEGVRVRGAVMRGVTHPHHHGMVRELDQWLSDEGVPAVVGVDTRALTIHLRKFGVVRGVLDVGPADDRPSDDELGRRLRAAPAYGREDYLTGVAVGEPTLYGDGGPLVAVFDCGVKASILRALLDRGLSVLRLPPDHEVPERFDGRHVAGLVVGNGPGDPEALSATIEELARPSNRDLPTLGICLGLQLLALSRGATTFKLKYGHRGQNKTVCFPDGRALIVSENHGYAVDPNSLGPTPFRSWATNPDDGTLEGIRDRRGRVFALQGHPEGHPGPQEAGFVFDTFASKVVRSAA